MERINFCMSRIFVVFFQGLICFFSRGSDPDLMSSRFVSGSGSTTPASETLFAISINIRNVCTIQVSSSSVLQ